MKEEGKYFNVNRGGGLSPILFNCALKELFRKLNWKEKGITINGKVPTAPQIRVTFYNDNIRPLHTFVCKHNFPRIQAIVSVTKIEVENSRYNFISSANYCMVSN